MKQEMFLIIAMIVGLGIGFGSFYLFGLTVETPEPVDYSERFDRISERFDRIEAGITNSTIDLCFQWGGQWITDQNNLVTQDFQIPLQDGSLVKGQAILCVKQFQEVQQ